MLIQASLQTEPPSRLSRLALSLDAAFHLCRHASFAVQFQVH